MTPRRSQLVTAALVVAVVSVAWPTFAQTVRYSDTPAFGGKGGGMFRGYCPRNTYLIGIAGRTGDWIDAIQPICAEWDTTTQAFSLAVTGVTSGGSGGGAATVMCPAGMAINGWEIARVAVRDDQVVQYVQPQCLAVFEQGGGQPLGRFGGHGATASADLMRYECPQGQIANGLHGASGAYVDSVGLKCEDQPFSLGRPVPAPGRRPRSVETTRTASTRIGPWLEAQRPPPAPAATPPPAPNKDILAANEFAAKGREIADVNPLVAALRVTEPEGPVRTGFDIGMGAWLGHTADGAGKQALGKALTPAEQLGFADAAVFSVQWNNNAAFAAVGAAIADQDPEVAAARAKVRGGPPDGLRAALYFLGFDIATGIFGDPRLGAKGNTLIGPGSEKIRATLGPDGHQGFNDSLAFNVVRR
jgi:hypothetical protein